MAPAHDRCPLACPRCAAPLAVGTAIDCPACGRIGVVDDGILRFGVLESDDSTRWYVAKGGSDFCGRIQIPYTMSSLDAGVYAGYLEALRPADPNSLIVDVGAADGRNTEPFLAWGYRRVVATDVSLDSLRRLQQRVAREHPERLEHLVLAECDARHLPLAADSADVVVSTEVLCCLNEGYLDGLRSCARILKPGTGSRLLVSERSWEGGMVTRLLYSGVGGLAQMKDSRDLMDGTTEEPLRTRTFTEDELASQLREAGLTILESKGTSMLSLLFGYLRGKGVIGPDDARHLPAVQELMAKLGEVGAARRTHTMVAHKAAA